MTLRVLRTEFSKDTQVWANQYRQLNVDACIPTMDLDTRLRIVEERLLIVDPPTGKLSKYPALAEAYKEYKIIEKLTSGNGGI